MFLHWNSAVSMLFQMLPTTIILSVTKTSQVWCSDVTYIWTGKRWAYLTVALDLFARKQVGWAMSFSPDSRPSMKALEIVWEPAPNQQE